MSSMHSIDCERSLTIFIHRATTATRSGEDHNISDVLSSLSVVASGGGQCVCRKCEEQSKKATECHEIAKHQQQQCLLLCQDQFLQALSHAVPFAHSILEHFPSRTKGSWFGAQVDAHCSCSLIHVHHMCHHNHLGHASFPHMQNLHHKQHILSCFCGVLMASSEPCFTPSDCCQIDRFGPWNELGHKSVLHGNFGSQTWFDRWRTDGCAM